MSSVPCGIGKREDAIGRDTSTSDTSIMDDPLRASSTFLAAGRGKPRVPPRTILLKSLEPVRPSGYADRTHEVEGHILRH